MYFCFCSVFGKCLENVRDRICFHLINSPEKLRKYVSKPSFDRFHIFNEDLIGLLKKSEPSLKQTHLCWTSYIRSIKKSDVRVPLQSDETNV